MHTTQTAQSLNNQHRSRNQHRLRNQHKSRSMDCSQINTELIEK